MVGKPRDGYCARDFYFAMKKNQKDRVIAASTSAARPSPSVILTQEQIATRAHDLWVSRGCPTGADLDIWLEAERTLRDPKAARFKSGTTAADDDIEGTEREDEELEDVVTPPPRRSTTAL